MLQAMHRSLCAGRPQAMIVGTDAPTLPIQHLEQLLRFNADMALGPAVDGGYYAIACRKVHTRMFDNVAWSTPDTLDRTTSAAKACGLTVEHGPFWYDIDTRADLSRLIAEHELPRHTNEILKGNEQTPKIYGKP